MKIHIVQQGDTIWKLAKKYGVDFEQLKAVNSHLSNPDVIMPGMKIKIPTGSVPVKKQSVKKEEPIQVKEQPKIKEMPKKEMKVPPPKMPEVEKMPVKPEQPIVQQPIEIQPIQQPMLTQQQQQYEYEQHLHNMNMNFNIYKPMPVPTAPVTLAPHVPAPPKMPEMKELPKEEKPKQAPFVQKEKEAPKFPKMDEMPISKPAFPTMPPMQQNCYPVTGITPGCSYNLPPVVQQYAQGFGQYPPMQPMAGYTHTPMGGYPGFASPMPAAYPQSPVAAYPQQGYGMGQPQVFPYYGGPQQGNYQDFLAGIQPMASNNNMQLAQNDWGQPNYGAMPPTSQNQQMYQQPPASPHPAHKRHIEEEETKK